MLTMNLERVSQVYTHLYDNDHYARHTPQAWYARIDPGCQRKN